jgi:hypothetical protein
LAATGVGFAMYLIYTELFTIHVQARRHRQRAADGLDFR